MIVYWPYQRRLFGNTRLFVCLFLNCVAFCLLEVVCKMNCLDLLCWVGFFLSTSLSLLIHPKPNQMPYPFDKKYLRTSSPWYYRPSNRGMFTNFGYFVVGRNNLILPPYHLYPRTPSDFLIKGLL